MLTKNFNFINILLIEDNDADVELIKEALDNEDIINRMSIVNDGEEALYYLEKKHPYEKTITPDIIILDLNLPKIDGREVLRIIKRSKKFKMIPVIILSTSDSEEDINKTYNMHANCYIKKPIDFNSFKQIVENIKSFWLSSVCLPVPKKE